MTRDQCIVGKETSTHRTSAKGQEMSVFSSQTGLTDSIRHQSVDGSFRFRSQTQHVQRDHAQRAVAGTPAGARREGAEGWRRGGSGMA
jgi:hypothetical protein